MDYRAFFWDMYMWTQQVNQTATRHGMESEAFWAWVAESAAALSKKYQDNRLVIKQMVMMIEWLEEVYESRRGGSSPGKDSPEGKNHAGA